MAKSNSETMREYMSRNALEMMAFERGKKSYADRSVTRISRMKGPASKSPAEKRFSEPSKKVRAKAAEPKSEKDRKAA
jgi:hypothetical protein